MENVLTTTAKPPLNVKKPLVKEFFDRDAEAETYLKLRLPHVSNAIPSIKKLFSSKDGLSHKYRVNWYSHVTAELVTIKKMVASQYVEVITTKEGHIVSFNVR